MLSRRPHHRPRCRVLAALAAWLAVFCAAAAGLPGPARAAVQHPGVGADEIRVSQQWVLEMLHMSDAWSLSQGTGVTVAVVDSGVDPYVSDLKGSVITGPDYSGVSTQPSDPNWGVHGTWMASLIAGHGHGYADDSGVIGIAPQSRVLSIRVIPDRTDPRYGKYEHEPEASIQQALANGINYAVAAGAQVISMSIGYSAPNNTVREALQNAHDHGVVVVASAGNSGDLTGSGRAGQAPESFPADYPGVISVGAVNSSGAVASFSSDNLSVQVAAPGVQVPAQGRDGQYWWVSGTSPACALVAGVAALIKSSYPGISPRMVDEALTSTTTDRPAGGYDSRLGFGIVDAAAALVKAGQLTGDHPVRAGIGASVRFGGGPLAVPPEPVSPRSSSQLVLFAVIALASLVLTGTAVARLAALRRARQ
jgi:subtilisin family serine protease